MSSVSLDNSIGACESPQNDSRPQFYKARTCTVCNLPIPEARLRAKPSATKCVPCLEIKGDVPLIRRFDEPTRNGVVETYFFENPYIESHILHNNEDPIPEGPVIISDEEETERADAVEIRKTSEQDILEELSLLEFPFWPAQVELEQAEQL